MSDEPNVPVITPSEPTEAAQQSDAPSAELPPEFLEKLKHNKRKRRVKMAVCGIAVVVVLGVGAGIVVANNAASNVEQETTGTYTQQVTQEDFELTVEGSGTLAAKSTTSVTPQASGTVKSLKVAVGDTVKKGQTLMTLESDDLSSALSSAASTLSDASSSYSDAKRTYRKAKAAYAKAKKKAKSKGDSSGSSTSAGEGAVPGTTQATTASTSSTSSALDTAKSALDQAKSALSQAKSTYTQAYEAYNSATEDMDALTVTAPAAGTVTELAISEGEAVTGGSTAALTIQNTDSMTLTMQVSEYDIGNIEEGQSAQVTVTALEKTVDAEVTSVATTASSNSGSSVNYDVVLTIDKPTKAMLSGMSATAEVVYRSYNDALIVPTSAISKSNDGSSMVTVQASDGSTKQVAVEVLGGTDEQSAVTGDLAAGDAIVVTYTIGSSDSSSSSSSSGMAALMGGSDSGGGSDFGGGSMPSGGGDSGGGSSGGGGNMPSAPGGSGGGAPSMPGGSN